MVMAPTLAQKLLLKLGLRLGAAEFVIRAPFWSLRSFGHQFNCGLKRWARVLFFAGFDLVPRETAEPEVSLRKSSALPIRSTRYPCSIFCLSGQSSALRNSKAEEACRASR